MIIYGVYDLGKVDKIESVGHVSTTFWHLFFVPIYPVESRFVKYFGNDLLGTPIQVNFRSALKGYGQFYLGATAVILALVARDMPSILCGILAVICCALWIWVYLRWRNADYETARKLAEHVGLNNPTKLIIENIYGRITDEDLDQYISDYESGIIDDMP